MRRRRGSESSGERIERRVRLLVADPWGLEGLELAATLRRRRLDAVTGALDRMNGAARDSIPALTLGDERRQLEELDLAEAALADLVLRLRRGVEPGGSS